MLICAGDYKGYLYVFANITKSIGSNYFKTKAH